jgi:hypothetical protein
MDKKNTDLSKIIDQNNTFSEALKKVLNYVETDDYLNKKGSSSSQRVKRSRKNNK